VEISSRSWLTPDAAASYSAEMVRSKCGMREDAAQNSHSVRKADTPEYHVVQRNPLRPWFRKRYVSGSPGNIQNQADAPLIWYLLKVEG